MRPRARLAAAALAAALAAPYLPARAEEPAPDGWRPFTAAWTLQGTRQLLPAGGVRPAALIHVSGPFTVTGGEGLGRGFLGEVFAFDDGEALLVGRMVFTDEKGDRIFCSARAEALETGRKATATITGGTGRYARLEGSFTLRWQYVVAAESGEIGGRFTDIEGRTRVASPGREVPR
ncbi:MAG TPA: hypothetical protein PK598_00505 [Thermoanaerobaculia bacterium]|nr:hypothetical protein [Thermoanaerobaculia bacterium]